MSFNKTLPVGTVISKTVTTKDGREVEFFELVLKQNVEIVVGNEPVQFATYNTKAGHTFHNKRLRLTPVEDAKMFMRESVENNKLSQDLYDDIVRGYEEKNVMYTVSISKNDLAK